jgi:glucosamine--fructose-6-phosphate aminotransferase (isomerizing)
MLNAGAEIGVASTKAFTAQLVVLFLLTMLLGRRRGMDEEREAQLVAGLNELPTILERTLRLDDQIRTLSQRFIDKRHALFLGRGKQYPIALEGALKLKEISYIHAEGYPAGELKHGPLALVDSDMPVVAIAPGDDLVEKLQSNLEEVRARGGQLIVFADERSSMISDPGMTVMAIPAVDEVFSPIVYTLPLQLLAYHAAVFKGTDVDQPRNLAKSVTVE